MTENEKYTIFRVFSGEKTDLPILIVLSIILLTQIFYLLSLYIDIHIYIYIYIYTFSHVK